MAKAGVPEACRAARTKPEIALVKIDRILAAGVRLGAVLADAGYGLSAPFRRGLDARGPRSAVGIPKHQKVYPTSVKRILPVADRGRPRKHLVPGQLSVPAEAMLENAKWRRVTWRKGTKGPLTAAFAAVRVRVADGPPQRIGDKGMQHMPGEQARLVGERRSSGEQKYYLANLPAKANLETLGAMIKARWVCEQAHQQLKEELGLDHFEGRSRHGLHRHALMTMIAYAYLQIRRLAEPGKKERPDRRGRPCRRFDAPTLPRERRSHYPVASQLAEVAFALSSGDHRCDAYHPGRTSPQSISAFEAKNGFFAGDHRRRQLPVMSPEHKLIQRLSILIPHLHGGGAERVAVNLANSFAARGYSVDMVLMAATGEFISDLRPEIRVIDLNAPRLRNVFVPLLRYLRLTQPEALLAFMWPLTVIALWARRFSGVSMRMVVSERTTWSRELIAVNSRRVRLMARTSMHLAFPMADGNVAVSKGAADHLAGFAGLARDSITVIYNPFVGAAKPMSTTTLAPAGWWSGPHRRVLAVGMLKVDKDYATLIHAFARLRRRTDARLLILGEGECRPALEAQVRQLGLGGSVFLPGFVKDPSPYYQQADLHVLSSIVEGLPNVIIEALAAGTPVVSTDCPSGPREILCNGQFGRLVPVENAAALDAAMAESLAATHDREALKARAQYFSIDRATDRYLELLLPHDIKWRKQ